MASVKLYLDTRKSKNNPDKQVQLKLAINHRSSTVYIVLGVALYPTQWDANKVRIKDHPDKLYLNAFIKKKLTDAELAILKICETQNIDLLTATELRAKVDAAINVGVATQAPKPKKDPNTFANWFRRFIDHKGGRTKSIYESTYKHLVAWLGEDKFEKLHFEDIKVAWLDDFNAHLSKTNRINTISIHMRNIRAVVNYAIDNEVTSYYAFRRYKINHEATRKRNFDVDTLRRIFNVEVEPWMERYRDMFKLSFMLIGINPVDLVHLQAVENGRVNYIRAKTKKPYSIKVEPEALAIIDRYRGEGQLLNILDTTKKYRFFSNRMAFGFKKMREVLNSQGSGKYIDTLSMYWARHSWATIAASLDIPHDTIARALGHGGNTVTDIYIEFDMKKVDEANRKVLDYVLYGVHPNAKKKRGRPKKA